MNRYRDYITDSLEQHLFFRAYYEGTRVLFEGWLSAAEY